MTDADQPCVRGWTRFSRVYPALSVGIEQNFHYSGDQKPRPEWNRFYKLLSVFSVEASDDRSERSIHPRRVDYRTWKSIADGIVDEAQTSAVLCVQSTRLGAQPRSPFAQDISINRIARYFSHRSQRIWDTRKTFHLFLVSFRAVVFRRRGALPE